MKYGMHRCSNTPGYLGVASILREIRLHELLEVVVDGRIGLFLLIVID